MKKNKSHFVSPKKGQPYLKRKAGLTKTGKQKYRKVRVYNKMPKGWKTSEGVMTNPIGFKMIDNRKSWFSKDRKVAFIRDKRFTDKEIKNANTKGYGEYHSK